MTLKTNMMSLGGYRFEAIKNPYHEMNNTKQYDYASHERYMDVERLQFKGRKARTMSLSIKIVEAPENITNVLEGLKKLGDEGKPLAMMLYNEFAGEYEGSWVITSITDKNTEFTPNGKPMIQEATLNLKEFVQDENIRN